MRFEDLETLWKRIFGLEWMSLQGGNKAIAAVIVSEEEKTMLEGRNSVADTIPNPNVAHAQSEANQSLGIKKYPKAKEYTLYASLEPCPMCLGMTA